MTKTTFEGIELNFELILDQIIYLKKIKIFGKKINILFYFKSFSFNNF